MTKVLLLAVGAAWAAVFIPALLRSRVENHPHSSVTDFRRQLNSLQRTVPTRQMGARGMARPLVQSPPQRTTAAMRSIGAQGAPRHTSVHVDRARQPQADRRDNTAGQRRIQRDVHDAGERHGHRQVHVHRVSQREVNRRRRANVLFMLLVANAVTVFLAATTKNSMMVTAFGLAFLALCGYCYMLVQMRNQAMDRHYGDNAWFNAA